MNDDFDGQIEICFVCQDVGSDFIISEGEKFDIEILKILGNTVSVKVSKSEQTITTSFQLDERTKTHILYTDWEYWSESIV